MKSSSNLSSFVRSKGRCPPSTAPSTRPWLLPSHHPWRIFWGFEAQQIVTTVVTTWLWQKFQLEVSQNVGSADFLSRLGVTYFPLWEIQPQFRMGTLCEFWFLHDCLMIGWSYVLIANGQLHQHHLSQWPFEGLTNAEKNRRHPHEKLIRWLDLGHWDIFHGWIAFCLIVLALVSSTHWWLDLS